VLPRAPRFKRPLHRCNACDPKAEVSGHAPQAAIAAPSGFQPAAARSSALTSRKWLPRMDSRHQPPGSEPGALAVELQGKTIRQPELHRSLADTSGVRRYQRFGGIEMVGHLGAAPSVSPIRTARITVFLVPDEKRGATGNRTPIYAMPLRRLAVGRWPRNGARARTRTG
jgi:hypothetical protein